MIGLIVLLKINTFDITMGKIITKEINKKIKQLVYTNDPINWELALSLLKGLPKLSSGSAEQKILQLLESYKSTGESGVNWLTLRDFVDENITHDKLRKIYISAFSPWSSLFSATDRYKGKPLCGMTVARGNQKTTSTNGKTN